jgi:hypothetical protein
MAMRAKLAAMFLVVAAASGRAGNDPSNAPRPPRGEAAPKSDLDRPTASPKPVDGKALCTYINPDQNATSQRGDCVAERDPAPQRPVEKTPPAPPGNDAAPSSR